MWRFLTRSCASFDSDSISQIQSGTTGLREDPKTSAVGAGSSEKRPRVVAARLCRTQRMAWTLEELEERLLIGSTLVEGSTLSEEEAHQILRGRTVAGHPVREARELLHYR